MDAEIVLREQLKYIRGMMPMDVQVELMAIADRRHADQWRIGDIANNVCDWGDDQIRFIAHQSVYMVVSEFLNNEITPRTVRLYAETARFYSAETRSEFDVLPFSHFAFAKAAALGDYNIGVDQKEKEAARILKISYEAMGDYGRPISVNELGLILAGSNGNEPVYPVEPPEFSEHMDFQDSRLFSADTAALEAELPALVATRDENPVEYTASPDKPSYIVKCLASRLYEIGVTDKTVIQLVKRLSVLLEHTE